MSSNEVQTTFNGFRFIASPAGSGIPGDWLKVIWEVNDLFDAKAGACRFLGEIALEEHSGGRLFEVYHGANVIHRGDGTVSIVPKSIEARFEIEAAIDSLKAKGEIA